MKKPSSKISKPEKKKRYKIAGKPIIPIAKAYVTTGGWRSSGLMDVNKSFNTNVGGARKLFRNQKKK